MSNVWKPIAGAERIVALDVIRGVALFGVLTINALTGFRLSLFETFFTFHTHPDWTNWLMDVLAASLLEFKAIALFSFLFGVGIGVQADRAATRGIATSRFLARRFLVLLAIGLVHMLLIWNGDILTLYAVCGLLIVPLRRLPVAALIVLGIAAITLPINLPFSGLPGADVLRAHAAEATRVYAEGNWSDILVFRWREAGNFIRPLLVGILPRTVGLMLLGVAAWRAGVMRDPGSHRRLLWIILLVGGGFGALMTSFWVFSKSTGRQVAIPSLLTVLDANVSLALAYAAGLLLWFSKPRTGVVMASLAAAGQMALSNYIAQSMVLGAIFYGYGFGLFGKLGPAPVALLCLALYAAQLAFSRGWLRHYRFGPLEWLWRSLTYGQSQPMRRAESPAGDISK